MPRSTVSGRLTRIWFLALGLVTAVPFVVTALSVSFKTAFNVLTGTTSPIDSHAGIAGVVLAVVGYLMVPTVVGTLAAVLFDRQRRASTLDPDEIDEAVRRVMAKRFPPPDQTRGGR
jgi:protein-S-isoprenylcysteine O-methyltransferase Ste14